MYIDYCKGEPYGQWVLAKEKQNNPEFAAFIDDIQRNPKALRLGIDHYLVRPRGRMGHYVTLLERVIKKTDDDNPDKEVLSRVISRIKEILLECNNESGKVSNKIQLMEFEQELDATENQLRVFSTSNNYRILL
jgi:YesN/AraC family two-component response regulator